MTTRTLGNPTLGIVSKHEVPLEIDRRQTAHDWLQYSWRVDHETGPAPLMPKDGEARVQWDYASQ